MAVGSGFLCVDFSVEKYVCTWVVVRRADRPVVYLGRCCFQSYEFRLNQLCPFISPSCTVHVVSSVGGLYACVPLDDDNGGIILEQVIYRRTNV